MTHPDFLSLFSYLTQIIKLSDDDRKIAQQLFHKKELKRNDFFLLEGQTCRQVGFINKGLMRYYINHNGEEKTYAFGQENCFVSNYESFIPQTPSLQNIQALEDSEVLTISYLDLQQFYNKVPQGERFGRIAIEHVFTDTLKDLNSFYTDTAEQRYEKFVTKYPDIQQRVPQYHIASFVGVKPQSLSRIRKRISG